PQGPQFSALRAVGSPSGETSVRCEDLVGPLLRLHTRRRRGPRCLLGASRTAHEHEISTVSREGQGSEIAPLETERARGVDRRFPEALLQLGPELRERALCEGVGTPWGGVVAFVDGERDLVTSRIDRRAVTTPARGGDACVCLVRPLLVGEGEAELPKAV